MSARTLPKGDHARPHHSRLPGGTTSVAIAHVAGQALAVVTAVVLARRLGAAGFGVYAVAIAGIYVLNVVTTFGTDMVLVREIARDRRLERCVDALALQTLLSVVAIAVVFSLTAALGGTGGEYVTPLQIFSWSLIAAACYSVASATLRGLERMREYAALVVLAASVPLAGVVVFVPRGAGPVRALAILLIAQLAVAAVAIGVVMAVAGRTRPALHTTRRRIVGVARESSEIGALGMLGVLSQRLALIGVAVFAGPSASGWYSGAARVVEASKVGHVALGTAALPLMAQHATDNGRADRHVRQARVRRSWIVALALAGGIAIALATVGPQVLERLYGPGFRPSRRALQVLALGVIPSTTITFRSLELLAMRREREVMRVTVCCLGVLVLGIAVLVPASGWIGACWAGVAADVFGAAALSRHRIPMSSRARRAREVLA